MASDYGAVAIVLPKNGTTLGICPQNDIWNSFYDLGLESAEDYYRTIHMSMMNSGIIDGSNEIFTIAQLREKLYVAKKNNIEIPSYGNDYLVSIIDDLNKTYDVDLLLRPFNSKGFTTEKISNFKSQNTREIWCDTDVVFVDLMYINEIISYYQQTL